MRRSLIPVLTVLLIPVPSWADTLGVRAGANYWDYDISGTAQYKTQDSANAIDVNDDLGYQDGNLPYYYITLEHPIPLLPNLRLSKTDIDEDANGRLSRSVIYGDIQFQANEDVRSEVQLDQTDITLYYSPLDNWVNVDLGLTARYIDSRMRISGTVSGSQTADISGWLPMGFAGVGFDLPLTGLSVSANGAYVKYQSSSFYDLSIGASYASPWLVAADVGYRRMKLDLEDFDDSYADVEIDGPYAGLYLNF